MERVTIPADNLLAAVSRLKRGPATSTWKTKQQELGAGGVASWYNDEATGVFANANGEVYLTGCTLDDRLPVSRGALQLRPKGNSEPFVLRMKFPPSE